jgi:thiosulfate/3-mercaptopyruvate sulfurtransferase
MSLIDAAGLLRRIGDRDLRIADVRWCLNDPERGAREYAAGHLPGAVFVDLERDLAGHRTGAGRHPLPEPRAFASALAARGIGSDHAVVVYDDLGGTVAARLWWMLDSLGHANVALLDGGIAAWVAAGGALVTDVPQLPPARLDLADRWVRTVDREWLAERLDEVCLLDHRAAERYRGEVEPIDPVAGHIPGSLSAPTSGNVDARGRFLAPAALAARYRALGAGKRPVVVSCGSGVTACQGALAMRIAGLPDPLLYPGSYSDWSTAGLPVATGPEPGTLPPRAPG